jgi:isopentenyl diphosphate isomerase/L-lactate dehydrogenase-like FMN-dependent dehydrogenase
VVSSKVDPFVPGADTSDDLRARAHSILPPDVFTHIIGGAGEERTMAANRAGFGQYRLLPRVLTDVSSIDLGVTVLGSAMSAPVFISPVGGIGLVHPDGEGSVARASATTGLGYVLSSAAGILIEDAAVSAGPNRWYQLYWQRSRAVLADLVRRAEDSGFAAIVLTVDNAVRPKRRRMLRGGYRVPASVDTVNLARYREPEWAERITTDATDMKLVWDNVEWLRSIVHVPFLLKGIMTTHDARRAVEAGADGVFISNHGGRNLDAEPGTIEVLEEIKAEVGDDAAVLLDGGVRSATDITIALGLGADAVGLGSPIVWALACGGEQTVTAYLEDLVQNLILTFGLMGVASVAQLERGHVSGKNQYVPDWALASFLPPRF